MTPAAAPPVQFDGSTAGLTLEAGLFDAIIASDLFAALLARFASAGDLPSVSRVTATMVRTVAERVELADNGDTHNANEQLRAQLADVIKDNAQLTKRCAELVEPRGGWKAARERGAKRRFVAKKGNTTRKVGAS